jgi:aspartate/methionine/tyrosine aminotransferase
MIENNAMQSLPPYLFARIEKKIEEAREKGIDIINLGIGDPLFSINNGNPTLLILASDSLHRSTSGNTVAYNKVFHTSSLPEQSFKAPLGQCLTQAGSPSLSRHKSHLIILPLLAEG